MNGLYAICPSCGKSIYVEPNERNAYVCSVCETVLDPAALKEQGLLIDVAAADEEYVTAQQYFANTDFRAAGEHFEKVLSYNRNHYLAHYYAALCRVYEKEDREDCDVFGEIVTALTGAVEKSELCRITPADRLAFLRAVLAQAHIILSSYVTRTIERSEKAAQWDELREKCLRIGGAALTFSHMDKERLMAFDPEIARVLGDIAELGVTACRHAVTAHVSGTTVDYPTDYECEHGKSVCTQLLFYVSELRDGVTPAYAPDCTENLTCNRTAAQKIEEYNKENKSNQKKCLSLTGKALEEMQAALRTAIRFSRHTCFRALFTDRKNKTRIALLNDATVFCLETETPRFSLDREGRLVIDVLSPQKAKEFAAENAALWQELAQCDPRAATEIFGRFFARITESVKTHFARLSGEYDKILDKLKAANDSKFRYYKNSLHGLVRCCALGLRDAVPDIAECSVERLKLLKLGKQLTDEFLLFNDYRVEELEKSTQYSDVLDIFNAIDDDIAYFSSKK